MAEIEENPSKRRKLDSSEALKDSPNQTPLILEGKNRTVASEDNQIPGNEENDLSKLEFPDPTKEDQPLSKNQLKKRKRQELWEAAKEFRKDKRRDKRHGKQARKSQQRAELQEKIAKGEIQAPEVSPEELKRRASRPVQVPITLILDCDFDELMTEKELISLGAQLTRCYSDNRHSKHRAHMVISAWNGALRTRFETALTNHHKSWKGVRFMENDFVSAGKEMDVVMRSKNGGTLVGAFTLNEPDQPLKSSGDDPQNENEGEVLPAEDGHYLALSGFEEPMEVDSPGKFSDTEKSKEATTRESSTETALQSETSVPGKSEEQIIAGKSPYTPEPGRDSFATEFTPNLTTVPSETAQEVEIITAKEPSIVYLTSDSPNTLDRLSPYTSYVIGGIVDKNRHKGLCYKRACERGIPTAKLPIGEYMTMQSRSVLATNHVMEIMLKWLDTGDWGEAFLSVIPKRKEAKLRVKRENGEVNGKDEESEDEEGDGGDEEKDS